jgi:hypothetical protein
MSIDAASIHAVQRPVHTLWSMVFIGPANVWIARWLTRISWATPMLLTLSAVLMAIVSAVCFAYPADPMTVFAGVVLYQLSTLADALDGTVARARPGSGSVAALLMDHSLDPWRLTLNAMAVAYGHYTHVGDERVFVLTAVLLAVHFADWIEPRAINQIRPAVQSGTQSLNATDRGLLKMRDHFERFRLRLICFSVHEREVCIFILAPLTGALVPILGAAIVVSAFFYLLRLRFDVALLRNEALSGREEYIGDSHNPWERGVPEEDSK